MVELLEIAWVGYEDEGLKAVGQLSPAARRGRTPSLILSSVSQWSRRPGTIPPLTPTARSIGSASAPMPFGYLTKVDCPISDRWPMAQGRRRAATTFRSRNHAWAKESSWRIDDGRLVVRTRHRVGLRGGRRGRTADQRPSSPKSQPRADPNGRAQGLRDVLVSGARLAAATGFPWWDRPNRVLSGPAARTYRGACEPGTDVPRGTKVSSWSPTLEGDILAAHPRRRRGLRRARDRCARDASSQFLARLPRPALLGLSAMPRVRRDPGHRHRSGRRYRVPRDGDEWASPREDLLHKGIVRNTRPTHRHRAAPRHRAQRK